MPNVDLRSYIVASSGTWTDEVALAAETPFTFTLQETCSAGRLIMRWPHDTVTLAGPLRVKVTFQSENLTYRLASTATTAKQANVANAAPDLAAYGRPAYSPACETPADAASLQAATIYSYTLDIPAGQMWPFRLQESFVGRELGNNFCDRVVIEVAGFEPKPDPVAAECGDLPCDFAVIDRNDTGSFFPVACEPCDPASLIRMPPLAPLLSVASADGGCIRTRFFNGMYITKEDLETEQRYFRIKNRLRNRAAGQGVVWGFNVGKQGDAVYVMPGYGVDCCGNDLTITTLYKVDIAALLRDPAACVPLDECRQMALLLEYVECPAEPRPVHNDPCGPAASACEPSRTRETVRLRLVPPRPPATTGPIAEFLATAQTLNDQYAARLETVSDTTPASWVQLRITGKYNVDVPARDDTTPAPVQAPPPGAAADGRPADDETVTISAVARGVPGAVFTGGTLRIQSGDNELQSAPLALQSIPGTTGLSLVLQPQTYTVTLDNWRIETPLAAQGAWADTGTATFTLQLPREGGTLTVLPTEAQTNRVTPQRIAACSEPCCPPRRRLVGRGVIDTRLGVTGHRRARLLWPWLHPDPLSPADAGDPKSLAIGILGAWLKASTASAASEGDVTEAWSISKLAAATLYRAAWLLFYGVDTSGDQRDVGDALQRLLAGWCAAMLYPGPICAYQPHGVVIGCTTVESGTIGDIDPFGGRQYVVQWPLVSHWASQAGIAPLELSATRLFSTLCCVTALPSSVGRGTTPAVLRRIGGNETAATYLAFGSETAVATAWKERTGNELGSVPTHQVTTAAFVGQIVSAIQRNATSSVPSDAPQAVTGRPGVKRYTLGRLVQPGVLSLLVESQG
jgi:hypothetical protein